MKDNKCKVIDFHTHIFPDKIAEKTIAQLSERAHVEATCSGTIDCLMGTMEEAGIDVSVIMPVMTKPSQFEHVNEFAAEVNRTYAGRLISFGGIHPDCEEYKEKLDTVKALGLPGIKIHPDYQGVMIDDIRYMRIIEYASQIGLIVLTHAGVDIGYPDPVHCPPDKMRKVYDAIRPGKLVLGHYGGWNMWEQVYEYLAGIPVYLDTAFTLGHIQEEWFMKIFEKHDQDKILFATDSPWGEPAEDLKRLDRLPLTPEQKRAILGENGGKLLGIQ